MAMSPLHGSLAAAGGPRGFFHFYARSAQHVLVEEGTQSYLTLPRRSTAIPRKFATIIYISPQFATSCSIFTKLQHPPFLAASPSVCNTFHHKWQRSHRRAALGKKPQLRRIGKKPPPRRIGQEATAAPHRPRSHHRAESGQEATTAQHPTTKHRRAASGNLNHRRTVSGKEPTQHSIEQEANTAPSLTSRIRPLRPSLSRSSLVSPLHP